MKKLFILRCLIIVFMILMIVGITGNILEYITRYDEAVQFFNNEYFGWFTFYIGLFLSVLFIMGLFYTQKTLKLFSKDMFFNSQSIESLKKSGILFLIFAVLSLTKNIFKSFESVNVQIFDYLLTFTILLIGFGMLTFVDILKKGKKIQEENELTI